MSFTLSPTKVAQLTSLRDQGRFADGYKLILDAATSDGAAAQGVDPAVWQWFRGAEQINRGLGPFAQFIYAYTSEQVRIRTGNALSEAALQIASNAIARAVLTDVIEANGTLPTLRELGQNDASITAAEVFNGDQAVWSGNLLFVLLGDDSFFRGSFLESKGDAYDFFAAVQSATKALGASASDLPEMLSRLGSLLGTGVLSPSVVAGVVAATEAFGFATYGAAFAWPRSGILLDRLNNAGSLQASDNSSYVLGADGDDVIYGRDKDGAFDLQFDILDGGSGKDRVTYTNGKSITVIIKKDETDAVLVASVDKTGLFSSDVLFNVEEIVGSGEADEFTLEAIDARLTELALDGGKGDDTLTITIEPLNGETGRVIYDMSRIAFGGIEVTFREFEQVNLEGSYSDSLIVTDLGLRNATLGLETDLGVSGAATNAAGERMVDTIDASQMSSGVTINLSSSSRQTLSSSAGTATFMNAEGARGSDHADTIIGGTPSEGDGMALVGGGGSDTITGGGGSDRLVGWDDSDADQLRGGGGSDLFLVGDGDVVLDPGNGNDEIRVRSGSGAAARSLAPTTGNPIGQGTLLRGGERELPPENPCQPSDTGDDSEDGKYFGADGTTYTLSGSNLVVQTSSGTVQVQNFRNGDAGIRLRAERGNQDQAECNRDPLILDLNGDRDVYDKLADSNAYFDLDNDGFAEHVAWTQKGDGFLVLDRNNNGLIDDGTELFGSNYSQRTGGRQQEIGENGYVDLAKLDSNGDYAITAADVDFSKLQVWIDENGDGRTQDGELKSLADLGIVSLSLTSRTSDAEVCGCDGTTVPLMSDVLRSDGSSLLMYDAFLAIDQYDTREVNPVDVPDTLRDLPFLIGSGTLSDLDVAMARDPGLEQLVREFADLDASRASEIPARVEEIILRWTGADTVAVDSRGGNINAQWLVALETISGSAFNQAAIGSNPRADAAAILIGDWNETTRRVTAELLGQTTLGTELMPGLRFAGAAFFQVDEGTGLATVLQSLVDNCPPGSTAEQVLYWHSMATTLLRYGAGLGESRESILAAIDALPSVMAYGLTANQIASLSIASGTTGVAVGTAPMPRASGADALFADVANATLVGAAGNDVYVLGTSATGAKISDSQGFDRLIILDQAREALTVTATIVATNADPKVLVTLRNAATGWSIELAGRLSGDRVELEIDSIDFADQKGVPVIDLLPPELYTPTGQRIYFGSGEDVSLLGGSGDDIISGFGTADRYRLNSSSGNDIIDDRTPAGNFTSTDRLFIDSAQADVTFEIGGAAGDALIVRNAAGQSVTILRQWTSEHGIEFFDFADGTRLTSQQLNASLMNGTTGADRIFGTGGTDLIDGLGGADIVSGNYGDDTYVFQRGYGLLTITDPLGLNHLQFGPDIRAQDISLERRADGILISIIGTSDAVLVQGGRAYQDMVLDFAEGSTSVADLILRLTSPEQLPVDGVIRGTSGSDFGVYGTEGNDIIDGLGGDEWLQGYEGDDTYVFGGSGEKEIFEDDGFDVIRLTPDLTFDTFVFLNGMILFEGHEGYITIDNSWGEDGQLSAYRPTDQVEGLIFADGRTLNLTSNKILAGTDGDDIIFNFGRLNETFTPGEGNDRIFASNALSYYSDNGVKTVILGQNFGHDVFYTSTNFKLDLTAFVLDSSVGMRRDGNDLIVSTDNGANDIRVKRVFDPLDAFGSPTSGLGFTQSSVLFAGGISLTFASVVQRMTVSSSSNDVLFGRSLLDGGAGDDTLIGGRAQNQYRFGRGDGHDLIKEQGISGQETAFPDSLTLVGLNRSDVTFSLDAADPTTIVITINDTGETVRIDGSPYDDFRHLDPEDNYNPAGSDDLGAHYVERIIFADGQVMSQIEIEQMLLDAQATSGDDTIQLFGAARRTPIGSYVDGGAGNDTYLTDFIDPLIRWSAGSGSDRVIMAAGFRRETYIKLNGIQPQDIMVTIELLDGKEHTILRARDGSQLAIPTAVGFGADTFVTAEDGTVYQLRQAGPLIANTVTTAGDDWLRGHTTGPWTNFDRPTPVNDFIDPGAGNDIFNGFGGSDTVRFGRGDGQDILLDSVPMGPSENQPQTYTIAFKLGVAREDVSVEWEQNGSGNLKISIIGTDDSLIVSPHNLVTMTFADGRVVRTTNIGDGAEVMNLQALRPSPTQRDDILFVGADETINGGRGNDTIYAVPIGPGSNVSATIEFGRGSGNDILSNATGVALYDSYLRNNSSRHTVALVGIQSLDEVRLIRSGIDLVIEIKDTGETFTVREQFGRPLNNSSSGLPVSTIMLGSGERLYWPYLQDMVIGSDFDGDNEIQTGLAGGVLDGGSGDDVLRGNAGDDSYILGRGYDQDVIIDAGGAADRIMFEAGVTADDVVFSRAGTNGGDLLIEVLGAERLTMTVRNQFSATASMIENFVFADGTTLSAAAVQQNILDSQGTSAADVIIGFAGADQINGGLGADQLTGRGSNDVIYGGAGRDTAIYQGMSSEYRITTVDGVTTIEDLVAGRDGADTLTNVEDLRFLRDASAVALTAANNAPTLMQAAEAAIAEDGELTIVRSALTGLASDPDGDPLTLTVGDASNGSVWIDRNGDIHFRPASDFAGLASFDYTVSDGNGGITTATYSINVAPTNDAPEASVESLGSVFVNEDGTISFALPANLFSDPDGNTPALNLMAANGEAAPTWLTIQNNVVVGTPPADFNGELNLAIVGSDGQLTSSVAFNLTIMPRNDAPVFTGEIETYEATPGRTFALDFGSQPFTDVDGDVVSVILTLADGSPLPDWMSFADNVLSGTPPVSFTGMDIVLTGSDGRVSTRAFVSLSVPLNSAPTVLNAQADVSVSEDHAVDLLLPANMFGDADGDALTIGIAQADGTALPEWLSFAEGRLTGTPPVNYIGAIDLRLTASDGSLTTSDVFRVTIVPVNDAPVVSLSLLDRSVSVLETIDFAVPTTSFTDVDGDSLHLTAGLVDGGTLPSWLRFESGRFTGQAPTNFAGTLLITVTASDGNLSASDQFSLMVVGTNEAPVAVDDEQFFTVQGYDLVILQSDVLANDTDRDGGVLSIVSLGSASHGIVSLALDGTIRYSPDGTYSGADEFAYTISDGEFTSTALISVRVESTFADWGQGTVGDDRLFGNHGLANRLFGAAGDDHIKGGMLDDRLAGSDGNDHIQGLNGNDHLWGGTGNDKLLGGGGSDTAYFMGTRSTYSVVTADGSVSVVDNAPGLDGDDGRDEIGSIELLSFKNGETISVISPIILDLDGNGVETVSASRSRARFDMNGDGVRDDTSWIGSTEGFLFLDRNNDGTVSNARELSFVDDLAGARTDLEGLKAFDSNQDGVLSALDDRFGDFKVWRDADGDGKVGRSEILSLDQVGLVSLNLTGEAHNSSVAFGDVAVVNTGSWSRDDGATMAFADAAMTYYAGASRARGTVLQSIFDRLREQNLSGNARPMRLEALLETMASRDFYADDTSSTRDEANFESFGQSQSSSPVRDHLFAIEAVGDESGDTSAASVSSVHKIATMVQDLAAFGVTPAGRIEHRYATLPPQDIFAA